MKNILLTLMVFGSFGLVGQENLAITSPEQLQGSAKVVLKREKAMLFMGLKARVRLNGARVTKVGNGKSDTINVPSGRNTLAVSGFGAPGESTVSFIAKAGEEYSFVIAPRSSNFWSGIAGGVFGVGSLFSTAFESTFSSSEGGTFGIAISGSSEFNKPSKQEESLSSSSSILEEELEKLKNLYDKGLIDDELYKEKQRELLDI